MCLFSHFCLQGKTVKRVMKHVYPLYRKKKNGKSKIDIDFQFLFLNWKVNGRMTHGPKVSSKFRPPPPPPMICLTHTRYSLFLTMDDKWYDDSRETFETRSRNTCISSMEKENDEHLNTLQPEVTKCEITKNYKSSFTVFWSFCRMTQSLQTVFLVVISRPRLLKRWIALSAG